MIADGVTEVAALTALQRDKSMIGAQNHADLGYFRSAAIWLTADLQSSLRLARADLMQATFATRLRASAQCCFRSAVHAFAAVATSATKF